MSFESQGDFAHNRANHRRLGGGGAKGSIHVSGPAVSRPGDLWILGDHRVFCGSALEAGTYDVLLEGAKAAAVFTDPPYNVKIDGHVCGSGAIKHREIAMASAVMTKEEFTRFLSSTLE